MAPNTKLRRDEIPNNLIVAMIRLFVAPTLYNQCRTKYSSLFYITLFNFFASMSRNSDLPFFLVELKGGLVLI